ncbi:MAG: DUF481 domain-containing protein [bacterium]|nr:DUF481 domain-containing protein [bacterium]
MPKLEGMTPGTSGRLTAGLLLLAALAAPAAAEKTDLILVTNGNQILGEVKSLERGKLQVSTDFMGTVRMDWQQIARIESKLWFEVEVRSGALHFGHLAETDEDRVLIVEGEDEQAARLPFDEILFIHQTEIGRVGKIDASISLGFSFNQASDVTQLSFDGEFSRRTRRFVSDIGLLAIVNDTGDESFSREDLTYTITRHLPRRWAWDASATGQTNEELGLESRWLVRGSALYRAVRTNIRELYLGAGLAASREEYTGVLDSGETNLEGTLGLRYFAFHFDDPELEVNIDLTLYPSLTSWGRLRMELRADLRRELVDDLFWGFSVYESYDSDPVGEDARNNDLTLTASLGWKY